MAVTDPKLPEVGCKILGEGIFTATVEEVWLHNTVAFGPAEIFPHSHLLPKEGIVSGGASPRNIPLVSVLTAGWDLSPLSSAAAEHNEWNRFRKQVPHPIFYTDSCSNTECMKSSQPVAAYLPLSQEVAALAGWCMLRADGLCCLRSVTLSSCSCAGVQRTACLHCFSSLYWLIQLWILKFDVLKGKKKNQS